MPDKEEPIAKPHILMGWLAQIGLAFLLLASVRWAWSFFQSPAENSLTSLIIFIATVIVLIVILEIVSVTVEGRHLSLKSTIKDPQRMSQFQNNVYLSGSNLISAITVFFSIRIMEEKFTFSLNITDFLWIFFMFLIFGGISMKRSHSRISVSESRRI
ncbi:MAG: hypothetical protein ACRBM6_12025 [Geminicoccales bacterium]